MRADIPCEKCGRATLVHTFREMLVCVYGELPLKAGGVFTKATADQIVDAVIQRLTEELDDETAE